MRLSADPKYFEAVESRRVLDIYERFLSPYNQGYTLVADILEMWFYIMTQKHDLFKADLVLEENWTEYGKIITANCNLKYLRLIKRYWSDKLKFYSIAIDQIKIAAKESRRKEEAYLSQLKKRKYTLKVLNHLVQMGGLQ